jgi:hypothetical protein
MRMNSQKLSTTLILAGVILLPTAGWFSCRAKPDVSLALADQMSAAITWRELRAYEVQPSTGACARLPLLTVR